MIIKYKFDSKLLSLLYLDRNAKYSMENIYTALRHICIGVNKNIIPKTIAYLLYPLDNNFTETRYLLQKEEMIILLKKLVINCDDLDDLLILNMGNTIPKIRTISIHI